MPNFIAYYSQHWQVRIEADNKEEAENMAVALPLEAWAEGDAELIVEDDGE
jgi:hypothetical protein